MVIRLPNGSSEPVPEAAVRSNNLVVHYETGIAVQHLYMYILISFSNDSPRSYPAVMLPLLSSPMYRIHRCNLLSLSRGDWLGHGRTSLVDGRGLVPAWTVTKDRSSTVRQSGRSYHNQGGEGESTHGVA